MSSTPNLSFMYFNARSLNTKILLLQQYANVNKPDIIAVSETWANTDFPDGLYTLPGYQLYRADRHDKRGGGVMIYTQNDVSSSEVI